MSAYLKLKRFPVVTKISFFFLNNGSTAPLSIVKIFQHCTKNVAAGDSRNKVRPLRLFLNDLIRRTLVNYNKNMFPRKKTVQYVPFSMSR